jgi:PAS domain S-box-containing protein
VREKKTNSLNLLILEDVPADADLIQHELRKAKLSFEAVCVQSEEEFRRELERARPDAILSDFSLPQFNALAALEILRERDWQIPFVLVTGSQSEEVAVRCIKKGADDYILKESLKRLPSALLGAISRRQAEQDRLAAQLALRESEEHFRTLIENSSDIITILSPRGKVLFESPSVERVLGYKPEDLVGRNAFDLVHPNDLQEVLTAFSGELKKEAEPEEVVEYRFRHRDGSWRFLESIGKNMMHDPHVRGIVVNSRDVTERKRAEERIHEQAALLDKATNAIMTLNLEGEITFWNSGAERLYGWRSDEAVDRLHESELYAKDNAPAVNALARTLRDGAWKGELAQVGKSGKDILVESRWTLVHDRDRNPKSILIINTDITEKKKLETHLLRSQRMESIGTLAGGIAHDLNNVLTPILMSIRVLREDLPEGGSRHLLDTLEASAQRGASIVQQVLSFARGAEGEHALFQIRHPICEVIKIARETFPPTITIPSDVPKDLWLIYGEATQVHQVLMNLLVNARDAMPHGGKIRVEAANLVIDESYARMQPDAQPGRYVVITVSDTGTGIPPALVSRIFEPFFTTKPVGKGTGLGLSTALGIVRSHGGFVNVYSEVGKGTTFKVHYPAAPDGAAEQAVSPNKQTPIHLGNGELVLIADDELAIREIIKVTLENHNYRVLTATDGAEAVACLAQNRNEVAVVIIDMAMPVMDGPAAMRALRAIRPELPMIAISGRMEYSQTLEDNKEAPVKFLAKPFTTEQLLQTLHHILPQKPAPRKRR